MKIFLPITMIGLTFLMGFALPANAQEPAGTDSSPGIASIREVISKKVQTSSPSIVVESVAASPIAGLYIVKVVNGTPLYASADGRYFISGTMFESIPGGFVDLLEKERQPQRAKLLAGVNSSDMIIFAPAQQPSKAVINVFTDVDCGYCQKLHREVPDLNRIGIEVRYLAYPRAGIGSDAYNKIASAWCSEDPNTAITRLKNRQTIPHNVCANNPVEEQFKLGKKMGVKGTPALLTADGRLLPGYMPALQLAKTLGVPVAAELAQELQDKQRR